MALKAFNDLIESDSLIFILLIFGIYFYIAESDALLSIVI